MTLDDFKPREQEFREFTRKYIAEQDAKYRETEAKNLKAKPLRHPNGKTYTKHDRRYLWGDFLFCQDRHTEPFEMFFLADVDDPDAVMDELYADCDGPTWVWLTEIFNEEFVKVCPDLETVLEG